MLISMAEVVVVNYTETDRQFLAREQLLREGSLPHSYGYGLESSTEEANNDKDRFLQ